MAKRRRKKRNLRLKKTARYALGAVLMITAIIVALIPTPDIKAGLSDYAYDVAQPEETDVSKKAHFDATASDEVIANGGYNLTAYDPDKADSYLQSFAVVDLGNGQFQYNKQFDYRLQNTIDSETGKRDGSKDAVLVKYNSKFPTKSLVVPSVITPAYVTVTETQIADSLKDKTTGDYKVYELSDDPATCPDTWFFEKYFVNDYNKYKAAYDAYWIQHQKHEKDPDNEPDGTMPDPVEKTTKSLSEQQQMYYYCDVSLKGNNAKGYHLEKILNGDGTGVVGDYTYIPRGGTNNQNLNDQYGFLKSEGDPATVMAIANGAFAGTHNVDTLDMSNIVKYIGTGAFESSFVSSVSFGQVDSIGNRAFKNCDRLKSVSFSQATTQIGTEAFYGTKITSLPLESSVKLIGQGAFANCDKLTTIDLSKITIADSEIHEFAFYNDVALNSVNMKASSINKIKKAAFAVSTGVTGNWTEVEFPSGIEGKTIDGDSDFGDYILAGRTNLKSVTMPANYGRNTEVEMPDGTLENCMNLEKLVFPDDKNGSCGKVSFKETTEGGKKVTKIFAGIINEAFCVYGPEKDNANNEASPRLSTRKTYTMVSNTVPYIYTDKNNVTYIEISDGDYLLVANQNGELVRCSSIGESTGPLKEPLVIPSNVGEYVINAIADGCFDHDKIKERIVELEIKDGSIKRIAANTFSNCPILTKVTVGDSVNEIGDKAFENCPKLEEVFFNRHGNYTDFKMGAGAFETGSDQLTFYGDIVEGYAPFDWAMDYTINTQGNKSVCYKSNYPTNLTVISYKQNSSDTNRIPTLVDYPFYENIDKDNQQYMNQVYKDYIKQYSASDKGALKEAFEKWCKETLEDKKDLYPDATKDGYSILRKIAEQKDGQPDFMNFTQTEQDIIYYTENITIPAAVKSVDAKDFFTSEKTNSGNRDTYVQDKFMSVSANRQERKQTLYKTDSAIETDYASTVHGGLFSGDFKEYVDTSDTKKNPLELVDKGNDRVRSISLEKIATFPDNLFDSCERLGKVSLGACTKVGTAPFVGCYNLTDIDTSQSSKYEYANGILYENNEDGSLTIVQCLPARGDLIKPKTVSADSDPLLTKVTAIREGAFQDCDNISSVDLSQSVGLKTIPKNCFNDCESLRKVDLPETVNNILDDAFTSCGGTDGKYYVSVDIPGTEVHITYGAFDHDTGEIVTYRESAAKVYADTYNIDWVEKGTRYTVSFVDYDGTALKEDQKVEAGGNAIPPEKEPVREGYIFAGWNKEYTNVHSNLVVMATYTDKNGFKVVFVDYDGKKLSTQLVPAGGTAKAPADPVRTGYKFTGWSDTYSNVNEDKIIVACYSPIEAEKFQVTFLNYDGTVLSTQYVVSGGNAAPPAAPARAGYTFTGWSGSYTNVTSNRSLIAQFKTSNNNNNNNNNGGNGGGGNSSGGGSSSDKTYHKLTVTGGSGGGYYTAGTVVTISAFAPPAGQNFHQWTSTSNGVGFTNSWNKVTTLTMPANAAEVVANFGVGTASSNNTVPDPTTTPTGGTGGSGGGSGSGSGSDSNSTGTKPGGTVVSITKPGFSDTDKASAVVHGSADNYIIKITEDANAQAQIEAALLADSETLENIKYFPMDISLYDSTGNTKITDTTGISIDITLPLPDELREYAGNNKVAGVVNGVLDKLTPTFKSIDGVPCVTFTATHFSPYTIYVDTANLSDGSIDSSPKTGDPIHPKWFLAIGLASLSILLFIKKDRRVRIKIS